MHIRATLFALVGALAGCGEPELGAATTWAQLKVEGLQLELVHEQKYELLMFGPQGTVSATVGTKGGPLVAPLWYRRVEGQHLVISEQPSGGTYADLHAPRLNGSFLLVRRGLFSNAKYAVKHSDA